MQQTGPETLPAAEMDLFDCIGIPSRRKVPRAGFAAPQDDIAKKQRINSDLGSGATDSPALTTDHRPPITDHWPLTTAPTFPQNLFFNCDEQP